MTEPQIPSVQMLWETVDPDDALRERFGLDDATSAGRWVADVLLGHWALAIDSCDRIVISDRNALAWVTTPSGRLLAKWSVAPARFPRLAQVSRLTAWLGSEALPVSAPVPSKDGRRQLQLDDISMGVQHVIEGDLLDVDDLDQVRAAGATLATLHHALAVYPWTDEIVPPMDRPVPLPDRVTRWLGSAADHVPEDGRRALRRLLAEAPTALPPPQLLHGDYRSANVLCAGPVVAAVIDFEETRLDYCIDELARSAVMLGTRFRDWGPVSAEVRETFLSGYRSVRQLTPDEDRWWEVLVLWYALALVPPGDDPTGWGPAALSHLATFAGTS